MSVKANRGWIWVTHPWRTDRGARLVDYAFLVALIALVCLASITLSR